MEPDVYGAAIAERGGAAVKKIAMVLFGWLVPGGAYLLSRRYVQFAVFGSAVTAAAIAGVALQGGPGWPRPEELAGLDGFTALLFQAGAAAKFLAGAPLLVASAMHDGGGFLSSRLHEYGGVLLMMAGVMNVLGVASALDQREG
jgi:hypothetical protein